MKIGVDLDDVLGESMFALVKFSNDIYGTSLKMQDIKTYNLIEILGGTKKEVQEKLHRFHTTFYGEYEKPVKEAREILEKIKKNNELYVITGRFSDIREETNKWIDNNFPNIFSKIYFSNEVVFDGATSFKKKVCDKLKIDIFIEDNLANAIECYGPNRKVFLFDRPWNQTDKLPKEIQRVYSWKEIREIIQ